VVILFSWVKTYFNHGVKSGLTYFENKLLIKSCSIAGRSIQLSLEDKRPRLTTKFEQTTSKYFLNLLSENGDKLRNYFTYSTVQKQRFRIAKLSKRESGSIALFVLSTEATTS